MKVRHKLPQTQGVRFVTDGGLETTVIFKDGIELPGFSAIHLMKDQRGRDYLTNYFEDYIQLARKSGVGFILESPTWRASSGWASQIELRADELIQLNKRAIEFLKEIKNKHASTDFPILIAGCIGPRGDGYKVENKMSSLEAMAYHLPQVKVLAKGGADFISALTLNYEEEAIGLVLAAREVKAPICISFTVETDGRLPNGNGLEDAINFVDFETEAYASYFMINCAHPTHFISQLKEGSSAIGRICGIRANASCKSHQELDNSTELDEGDPVELGKQLADLEKRFPQLTVLGGCCGTDIKHIEQICEHRTKPNQALRVF